MGVNIKMSYSIKNLNDLDEVDTRGVSRIFVKYIHGI